MRLIIMPVAVIALDKSEQSAEFSAFNERPYIDTAVQNVAYSDVGYTVVQRIDPDKQ